MIGALELYTQTSDYIEDLKSTIILNKSRVDFVTSDDPTFFANRFCAPKLIGRPYIFGLITSGLVIFMPLTPRHTLMLYDGAVYTVPKEVEGHVLVKKRADACCLNELQYLKAHENIYFSNWEQGKRVQEEFLAASSRRLDSWHQFTTLVPDDPFEARDTYRLATELERQTARRTLVMSSPCYPKPSRWISLLRFRHQPKIYTDGSSVGYVRKKEWLRGGHRRNL